MKSIRTMAVSLAAAMAVSTSVTLQAQSAPTFHQPPVDPAISSAIQQHQGEVKPLMVAYLGLWLDEDPSRYAFDFVTEDAVFEYPYADDGYSRIEGREAIGQALRRFPVAANKWIFSDLNVLETSYPDVFFVEYKAKAFVPATQHIYESRYLARITVKDGKIANYFELWDRHAKAVAFGTGKGDRVSSAPSAASVLKEPHAN